MSAVDKVLKLIKDKEVQFVSLQFTDMFGTLQNFTVPASQVSADLFEDGADVDVLTSDQAEAWRRLSPLERHGLALPHEDVLGLRHEGRGDRRREDRQASLTRRVDAGGAGQQGAVAAGVFELRSDEAEGVFGGTREVFALDRLAEHPYVLQVLDRALGETLGRVAQEADLRAIRDAVDCLEGRQRLHVDQRQRLLAAGGVARGVGGGAARGGAPRWGKSVSATWPDHRRHRGPNPSHKPVQSQR